MLLVFTPQNSQHTILAFGHSLIITELLRKVKIYFEPWRMYKAGKGPQQGMGVTKGQVGRIAGGNHHPFSKLTETLEVKELE